MAYASPWRVPAFRRLYAATAADQIGIQVGHLALPLVALGLGASPGQIGLLAALGTSAYLLIGLPSGVWVDRLGCVPVLVTAALARVVLLIADLRRPACGGTATAPGISPSSRRPAVSNVSRSTDSGS